MPVGSHKDAFKAHQLVKKIVKNSPSSHLSKMAADILLDFVKNQRQVTSDSVLEDLPIEDLQLDQAQLDKALTAVDGLCGKCQDAHDDSCFVNQARRVLIAARTGVDIGSSYNGKKSLDEMLVEAEALTKESKNTTKTKTSEVQQSQELSSSELSELDHLREQDIFRATLIDEVVNTIQSVSEGNYATEMPIHEDEQLGKLAKTFNLMLSTVKKSMANLDELVEERTAELKQIMNTVSLGLLSIDNSGRIMPEHSLAACNILNQETLRGRDYLELLGITRRQEKEHSEMEEFFDVVRMGMLNQDDLAPLNPFPELELQLGDTLKWLRLNYSPVKRNNQPTGEILVEINDITERKRLAAKVDASQKENIQLKVIAEDPDLFREFLGEVKSIQRDVTSNILRLSNNPEWKPIINDMFRGIHTIKGAAGSFGLSDLSDIAGLLENELSAARSANEISSSLIDNIDQSFSKLNRKIEEACETASTVLGEELTSDGPSIRVPLNDLKEMEHSLIEAKDINAVADNLKKLQQIPAHRALSRSTKIVPDLISRLGKNIDFVFEGRETLLNFDKAHLVNKPLVHLLRNACDHGIESPELRKEAGKPDQATITLKVETSDKDFTVEIKDDGKGINPNAIMNSALKKGIISTTDAENLKTEDKLKLIFMPGFSTAEKVTEVSGRGVGLDAVKAAIEEELNGSVRINSEEGKGTSFKLEIPCSN